MTAKMSAARRGAFLRALGRTGNYAVAAEQAGVSRGWVLKARHEEPAFDAACRETVAAVHARLEEAGAAAPGSGSWGHLDGARLVVRGTGGSVLRDAAGAAPQDERKRMRRVQIGRARAGQWGPQTEDRFLSVLSATCSVKAAYTAAGMSKGSAYGHRLRWPGFAARWDAAIELGAVRLELALARWAQNLFSRPGLPKPAPMPRLSIDDMLHNLYMHGHQLYGIGKPPGLPPAAAASGEEACERVIRMVEIFERGAEVGEDELAELHRNWAARAEAQPAWDWREQAARAAADGRDGGAGEGAGEV
ncbi:MAG TPA: hypothetical protein VF552_05990 [Allosphingosinicella sp.]|jgi:hypothetical protein